jgi:predicted GNAT family acetyltransferase
MTTPKAHWSDLEQRYWMHDDNGGVAWFDSEAEALKALRQYDIDNAVQARETLIAEWLRKHGYRQVAMKIESKEHLT